VNGKTQTKICFASLEFEYFRVQLKLFAFRIRLIDLKYNIGNKIDLQYN